MDPTSLKYARSHEWIEGTGARRKVGISDFAQHSLGDIVFVEYPALGKKLAAGEEACIVESCKATSGVYAPVAGRLVAVNDALIQSPETINQSPYDAGWLFELELDEGADDSALLDAAAYEAVTLES